MISKFIQADGIIEKLLNSIENADKISVFGCGTGEKLTLLKETGKFVLFLCEDAKNAHLIKEKFESINMNCEIITEGDDYFSLFNNNLHVLNTLKQILLNKLNVLVITPEVLFKNFPQKQYVISSVIEISEGQNLELQDFIASLTNFGFCRKECIENPGEFSVKGDVLDFYCSENEYYRIMFDFDVCGKIKVCDPVTLLPVSQIPKLKIFTRNYLEIDNLALKTYLEKNKSNFTSLLKEREENKHNLILFEDFSTNLNSNIFEYLPDDSVIAINDSKSVYSALCNYVENFNNSITQLIKEDKLPKTFKNKLKNKQVNFPLNLPVLTFQFITNANKFYSPNKIFNISSSPAISYTKNLQMLVQDLFISSRADATILIFTGTNEGAEKIFRLLNANRLPYNFANTLLNAQKGAINVIPKEYGISARFDEENFFVYGTFDLFLKPKSASKNTPVNSFDEAFLPETNDFVVHNTYGIGKYLGVKCLNLKGGARDYFVIEYKNNDTLYLPVENISSLSKYVGSDKAPVLNKLGGNDFIKTKEKVKSRIKESAINLVALYAERQNLKGFKYPKDDELMAEFENSFGYHETADQLNAINDVKQDMESGKLMDRLICGDVGFGKTEVALRCAFKTILAGKQVAFMCPTTILSQQHYNTCLIRLKNFGINVEVLNRFKSNADCLKIFEKLASGEIDLVVGTHKLLNKNIHFKNLGLLILDEEQKFGVEAKEYIKSLKNSVNVLTLSATPIPRTLHMSLIGVRDISVIETPPTSRIPTQVFVLEYDDNIIKNSVQRELNRGGQVLIIYNKVESIYSFASKVKQIIGEDVALDVTHGQMNEKMLEDAIFKLYNGQTRVLISTTLIENGVDLPNANTLIVVNADALGLSQLYQLKGRIGRGDKQAYAYFTYNANKLLNENAFKRLQAISQYTAMGSGFKIALKDLEIRGSGNVLGLEQSGHMEKIGYALYLQLLNETIGEIKGQAVSKVTDVKIETDLPAYLPNNFITNYHNRISLYLKISKINSVERLKETLKQLSEIYGELPEEMENLCKISLIREFSSKILASKVVIKKCQANVYFTEFKESINNCLISAMDDYKDYVVLNVLNSPIITLNTKQTGNVLDLLINFLQSCMDTKQNS